MGAAGLGSKITFPLGGLVNHNVQVFMRGCLTLKFSASWKTVMFSPFEEEGAAFSSFIVVLSPLVASGELVATSAILG